MNVRVASGTSLLNERMGNMEAMISLVRRAIATSPRSGELQSSKTTNVTRFVTFNIIMLLWNHSFPNLAFEVSKPYSQKVIKAVLIELPLDTRKSLGAVFSLHMESSSNVGCPCWTTSARTSPCSIHQRPPCRIQAPIKEKKKNKIHLGLRPRKKTTDGHLAGPEFSHRPGWRPRPRRKTERTQRSLPRL
jgi:hypothetical protein